MSRKNKAPATRGGKGEKWFFNNVNRQRKRFKQAKLSRRRNRS